MTPNLPLLTPMTKSDIYLRGTTAQLAPVKTMVTTLAERTGCLTDHESRMNIPLGLVMQLLIGDTLHLGLLEGINTEDPYCIVIRFECKDIVPVYEALQKCFPQLEIEVDEDVEDVPWPFE